VCLSAEVPAFAEPDIYLLSPALGPSQKIEFVFAASPETIRGEPREFDLRRSVGKMRDLAACALCNPVAFFLLLPGGLGHRALVLGSHKLPLPAIHREQIRDHLPGYG
jgi:hypothetical protein